MAGTTAEAQVQKKCYKNQTAGNLGVVKLDHLGAQVGANVKPYGEVWLTDDEAILTARAPEDPKHNPFEEQPFLFQDNLGNQSEQLMRPLILIETDRYSPADERFVPAAAGVVDAGIAAGQADTAAALSGADRPVPTTSMSPVLAPSSTAAVPPSHTNPGAPSTSTPPDPEEDLRESWSENPDRTVEPQAGSLGGSAAADAPSADPVVSGSPAPSPPQQPAPQAPPQATPVATSSAEPVTADVPTQQVVPSESAGVQTGAGAPSEQSKASPDASATVTAVTVDPTPAVAAAPPAAASGQQAAPAATEETAAVTETGEETGAAATPAGQAPEGEFAIHEEVGSPEAPNATEGAKP